jgi:hypothetical protein
MTALFQHRSQFPVVVNLTVKDDPDGAVFIGHWLVPATKIHDREAAVPKSNGSIQPDARVVRPTMFDRIPHDGQLRLAYGTLEFVWNGYTADATHNVPAFKSKMAMI